MRIVPDGTGIEWRKSRGVIQHRYAAELFGPEGKPGPWQDTPDVDQIVHPKRLATLSALHQELTEGGEGANDSQV